MYLASNRVGGGGWSAGANLSSGRSSEMPNKTDERDAMDRREKRDGQTREKGWTVSLINNTTQLADISTNLPVIIYSIRFGGCDRSLGMLHLFSSSFIHVNFCFSSPIPTSAV
jgi:hypothetical protein